MDYRSWLQQQANSHADSNTRKQASAVLQRVGDDQRLDDGWMNNPLAAVFDRTNGYGKQSVINMNDNFKNMYTADMNRIADSPIVYANNGNTQPQTPNQQWAVGTGGGGGGTYRPNDDARILAELNQQLGRYDARFGDVDIAERNRMASILNDYNRGKGALDKGWGDAQEDHGTATRQRLANRQRSRDVIDDDFRNQSNAYDRFFARHGAGSSSAAQYNVPTQLGRARLFQPLIL